jgi:peroxiredoxin
LGQLQSIEGKLVALGYQILAVSPDRPEKLAPSVGKHGLKYQLFSDSKMTAAKAFGLAWKVDDATIAMYKEYKIDLDDASGESHHLLPVPAAYVVDAKGVIRYRYFNPDYKVRVNPDELLREAKAALK